jgi:hypothetical protein
MAERNVITLYKRDVVTLRPTPVHVYENTTFTLNLQIEQDPLKLFPFQEMCDENMQERLREEYNLTVDQLVPHLVQLRGVWGLLVEPTLPRNSVYRNINPDMPASPDTPLSPGSAVDRWLALRVFRTGIRIVIGDDKWIHILTTPGNPEVLVRHSGNYKCESDAPHRAGEGMFAHSVYNPQTFNDDGEQELSGSGPGYDFTVSWDGYCITNVSITSRQPIRVGLHVEQDRVNLPGGWGVNKNSTVDYYGDIFPGGPTNIPICTIENTLPYTMADNGRDGTASGVAFSSQRGLGAHAAAELMYWVTDGFGNYAALGLPQPRSTIWQGGPDYSVDTADYDWTSTGVTNLRHFMHTLAHGWCAERSWDPLTPNIIEQAGKVGYVRCPGLLGTQLRGLNPLNGEYVVAPLNMGFGSSFGGNKPTFGGQGFQRIDAVTREWYAVAKNRLVEFERVVTPPRVKITASWEAVGGEFAIEPQTKVFYAPLPYRWETQLYYSFSDIYTWVEPLMVQRLIGDYVFQVYEYVSDDRFSWGEIQPAVLNCELMLNKNGFDWTWRDTLEGFDGASTIPQEAFTEGANSYIYDARTDQSYFDWLVEQ